CYAQLFFDEEIAVKKNDYYVIRYFSPVETIGGGFVLDANPRKHRKKDTGVVEALRIRETGDDTAVLEQALKDSSRFFTEPAALAKQVGMAQADAFARLKQLQQQGRAVLLPSGTYVHEEYCLQAEQNALRIVKEFHQANPLLWGMPKEELRNKFSSVNHIADSRNLEYMLQYLRERGNLEFGPNMIKAAGFAVVYTPEQQKMIDQIAKLFADAGFEPPLADEVCAAFKDKNAARQLLYSMAEEGLITRIGPDGFIHTASLNEALDYIKQTIRSEGAVTLAQVRDRMNTSRKYALAVLDYCDAIKLTRLVDDRRIFY
ncbi:MAG: SelB C-terminal domain-containing protein, partial [Firmicutes bacterium]|nr:SelB C-terminal domain-containing protein [Bacillota bacterium]